MGYVDILTSLHLVQALTSLALVDINSVKDVQRVKERDGWESLVLPGGHKKMVRSLVEAHFRNHTLQNSQDDLQVDLVRGKGMQTLRFYLCKC